MLTREQQDDILLPTVRAYRSVSGGSPWKSHDMMVLDSFRAALRLDDDNLGKIIADHPEGLEWVSSLG